MHRLQALFLVHMFALFAQLQVGLGTVRDEGLLLLRGKGVTDSCLKILRRAEEDRAV